MNAVDVNGLKTVVRISQLGAHELNQVRPTLAFENGFLFYLGKTDLRPRIAFQSFSPNHTYPIMFINMPTCFYTVKP